MFLCLVIDLCLAGLVLDDVLVDQLGIIDEKPGHFLLEELDPSAAIILLISQRRLIGQVAALTIIRFELLLAGRDVVLGADYLRLGVVFNADFHAAEEYRN